MEEVNHVKRHVKGDSFSDQELVNFWTDIHKDNATLFSKLLDPEEKEKFQETLLYEKIFDQSKKKFNFESEEMEDYVILSNQINDFNSFTATLMEEQAVGSLQSIIHPRLALHIHREGLRSLIELHLV